MKVALVYDRINTFGGAERILLALHKLYPDAPLYTAVHEPKTASWSRVFDVRPTFLAQLPFANGHHEWFPWLTPLVFETLNFDNFDLVITITSAEAKGILTKPKTTHVCYCLTPTRYLWSGYEQYVSNPGFGIFDRLAKSIFKFVYPTLCAWDLVASSRPDYYLAISNRVKERIDRYYHRDTVSVIYPPVDIRKFTPSRVSTGKYFLVVSRLVSYKRVDLIIEAFNQLQWPLVIIGNGRELKTLQRHALTNIHFITKYLTDTELVGYYQNCRAFVFMADEDFGVAAVEAQACGKPVVAYQESGIAEIVVDGKTGILFKKQDLVNLIAALKRFLSLSFDRELCRQQAIVFDEKRFIRQMKQSIESLYYRNQIV